mgnify:CR=1 FL=1
MAVQLDRQVSGNEFSGLVGRTRPIPVSQVAPKRSDGEPSFFLFGFYEAAVRDLTHSTPSGPWKSAQSFPSRARLDDWFAAANLQAALARPGHYEKVAVMTSGRHADAAFPSVGEHFGCVLAVAVAVAWPGEGSIG